MKRVFSAYTTGIELHEMLFLGLDFTMPRIIFVAHSVGIPPSIVSHVPFTLCTNTVPSIYDVAIINLRTATLACFVALTTSPISASQNPKPPRTWTRNRMQRLRDPKHHPPFLAYRTSLRLHGSGSRKELGSNPNPQALLYRSHPYMIILQSSTHTHQSVFESLNPKPLNP